MKTPNPNITTIRQSLGTGPVREERKPGATVKKRAGAAVGPKEQAMRALREAQAQKQKQPSGSGFDSPGWDTL